MSRNRYGGFRTRRLLAYWDDRKADNSNAPTPTSILDFDYSTAKGIWTLASTNQFPKRSGRPSSLTFVASSTSSTSTISFPTGTQGGDLAVLVEFSTTVSSSVPSGWTNINEASTTGMLGSSSYKVVNSTDLLSAVTGLGGTTRKIMMSFRPSIPINSITIGSVNSESTTAAPANQTLTMSGVTAPVIGIVNYSYTGGTAPTRGSTGLTMTEVTGSNIFARYVIFNSGNTPTNGTISMTDAGTNALQSFYIQVF